MSSFLSPEPVSRAASPPAVTDMTPFRERRERFLAAIGEGVAVIPAAPELLKSRDTEIRYRPDSDLFFLTGFGEPEAVAVLTPHDPAHRFTLFVRPRDPSRETWTGPRAGVEGARERFGADAAYPIEELGERLHKLLEPADAVWLALGVNAELDRLVTESLRKFRVSRPRSGKGPWDVRDPGAVLDATRLVKEPNEVERMREAARVSAQGHLAAMRVARPGVGEWELEAALDGTFRRLGAFGPSFPSIVGSGANATVLHYVTNDRVVADGDLVLVDAGAEVGMYCGDITRTWPVSGRFSPAQREVYDLVLEAEEAAIAAVGPGVPFSQIHEVTLRVLVPGMVRLGLLEGEPEALVEQGAYRRFYMHQTSHWLGLDVHDAGPYRERGGDFVTLRPGMVLTIEPGLYIPVADDIPERLRGIGVRIEDDVLVTEEGHEILTRDVPVRPEEVEALVGSGLR